jgi:hypothetical protein
MRRPRRLACACTSSDAARALRRPQLRGELARADSAYLASSLFLQAAQNDDLQVKENRVQPWAVSDGSESTIVRMQAIGEFP